jgi:23S rRNA (cytidine1920-2'-O)/16S rRNA (cytidine1409-2'-O)-methyltransferase
VRRGLVETRAQAQAAVADGRVRVAGAVADKPARLVAPGEPVAVVGPKPRFVGRGGEKLDAALDRFGIDVAGRRALDAGSSTGGFTDCLLQRGSASVVAVDVGRGQLHERLRADPRLTVLERTDVRDVDPAAVGGPVDVLTADLSFISLRSVLPALLRLAAPAAPLVLLVKPQFEAGRREVSRGRGVVTDPAVWRRVLDDVAAAVLSQGAVMMGCMVSPLRGTEGNVEFLAHVATASHAAGGTPATVPDLGSVVAEAAAREA